MEAEPSTADKMLSMQLREQSHPLLQPGSIFSKCLSWTCWMAIALCHPVHTQVHGREEEALAVLNNSAET